VRTEYQQLANVKRKSSFTSKRKPKTTIFNLFSKKRKTSVTNSITNSITHLSFGEERRKFNHIRKASSAIFEKLDIDERDIALFKTLVIILACYIFSTVPLGLLFLVSHGETDKRYVVPAKVLLIISLINSLLNPIIYMMRFKEMKKDFKNMFCLACKK